MELQLWTSKQGICVKKVKVFFVNNRRKETVGFTGVPTSVVCFSDEDRFATILFSSATVTSLTLLDDTRSFSTELCLLG